MTKFCVYRTVHPVTGEYYIGRSLTDAVLHRGYQGSGVKIKNKLRAHPGEFVTTIVEQGLTSEQADELEAKLVTVETLQDPLCLNLIPGGGAPGWIAKYDSREIGERISQRKKEEYAKDPAKKARQRAHLKRVSRRYWEKMQQQGVIVNGVAIHGKTTRQIEEVFKKHKYGMKIISKQKYVLIDLGCYVDGVRYPKIGDFKKPTGSVLIEVERNVWTCFPAQLYKRHLSAEMIFTGMQQAVELAQQGRDNSNQESIVRKVMGIPENTI